MAGVVCACTALAATPTGKQPIEGSLTTNHTTPSAGDTILVYLNATPLVDAEHLTLKLILPEVLTAAGDVPLQRTFGVVPAQSTVTHVVPVRVGSESPARILASATLADAFTPGPSRAFVLDLNPGTPAPSRAIEGRSGSGERLIIYPGEKFPDTPEK